VPKTRTSKTLIALTAVAVTIGTLAAAADVLSQFQLTPDEANEKTFEALWSGTPPDLSSVAGTFRTLTPDARAAAVTAAAAVARSYAESDAFRERYALERRAGRPQEIQGTTLTAKDVDKQAADSAKVMTDIQSAMKDLPPEMRKMMESMMKEAGTEGDLGDLDAALAEGKKAAQEGAAAQKQAIAKTNAAAAKSQQSAKEFDAAYPANPDQFVARRLREFLDYSATVPDSAVLVPRSGKMIFADPELEKKPEYWKQLYRAGKPAREAARAAAAAWLKTLDRGVK
jgi:hypothetical protein